MFAFWFQGFMWLPCSSMGTQPLGLATLQPFWVYPWQAYVPSGDSLWPLPEVHKVAAPPTALCGGELHATHSAVSSHSIHMMGHTALEAQQSPNPYTFPTWQGGVFFSTIKWPIYSKSVVGIKLGDSDVVIGYHIDEYTHTWLAEHFTFILVSWVRCPP